MKMIRLKQWVLQVGLATGFCLSAQASDLNFGVVDEARVYDQFYKKEPAEEKFQKLTDRFQAEHDKLAEEGNKIFEERKAALEKLKTPGLTDVAKEDVKKQLAEIEKRLDEKAEQVKTYRQEKMMLLQEQRQQIIQEHFEEIKVAIEQVAKAKGCKVVFGAAAIAYADQAFDLTDEVIKEANKPAKLGANKASDATPAPATSANVKNQAPSTKKKAGKAK